ncbi:MAG: molybdopterin biosynthesis protein, partial [Paracoccaceae bacterium]|nr:molybdopterin biosynthesis protein [Paracoccaceae bacterium]
MIRVLALIAGLWGLGWLMKAPVRARLVMIGALMAGVIAEQLLLPDGHPLRMATGGSAKVWLVLAGILVLIVGYGAMVRQLKARATPPATTSSG